MSILGAMESVFSTHVEVFLQHDGSFVGRIGLLHACGGVSQRRAYHKYLIQSSPRMWRCFHIKNKIFILERVFSTHVEVFLEFNQLKEALKGLLHACGGVSFNGCLIFISPKSSPRMWRCFLIVKIVSTVALVFSTHVVMLL